mmetsp:Transcript_28020/g.39890  ORF Transcript_28020/g.39890 Transcript_28020/m.39890 type:complete len:1087 (+) Transcript_28020:36-3296(+)
MGNQGSSLGDEPSTAIAQKNLQHFDHSFKGELHSASGNLICATFGKNIKFAKRPITIICKSSSMDLIEEVGITNRKQAIVPYALINGISWDHGNSEVKFDFTKGEDDDDETPPFVILTLSNSVEFEGEVKLRLNGLASTNRGIKIPSPLYFGMFAGATKPKPFQRKRPNLSSLPSGKLPPLAEMRSQALELHKGAYRPCPQGESRRMSIALQHIYEGCNTFQVISARGSSLPSRSDSTIVINDECITFGPRGSNDNRVEYLFSDITDWNAVDNESFRSGESGINITLSNDESVFFGVSFIRDVKHTLEYFWNRYKVSVGQEKEVKLGSTHGRPIMSVYTLSGEIPPPDPPVGHCEVIDQDGIVVRPGGKMVPRRNSIGQIAAKEMKVVPSENREVKRHWHKVVLHQGWLLKQGGVGVGTAKSWIKRYFVLYKTSQGHFLVYYSDFTECPMYTTEKNHRNIVDLAKATFIRPGSNKSDSVDIPAYCFDIVTTEREWTLCAESQENVLKWLKLINFAVDADVAILADEELLFKVKPKVDPLGILNPSDYSTTLKVSANGISVCAPDVTRKDGSDREYYFWVYTDFFKWSLLSQGGKLALLVNVFADSSFSRRNEYIFRNKEAVRLATAIEYFIEKFMSVMHIRLETQEGAFDDVGDVNGEAGAPTAGLHGISVDDDAPHEDEIDLQLVEENLLDMEISPAIPAVPSYKHDNDFAAGSFVTPSVPARPAPAVVADPFGDDDPFGLGPLSAATVPASAVNTASRAPAPTAPKGGSTLLDDLLMDPIPSSTAASNVTINKPSDVFGSDPFGDDPFGSSPTSLSSGLGQKVEKPAPPLTPFQQAQHKSWLTAALAANGGPFYDDGVLQVTSKIEIRGSQCRLSLAYVNNSPGTLSDLQVSIADPAGLIRFELGVGPTSLPGLGRHSQVMMAECIKPAGPGPSWSVSYLDSLSLQRRSCTLPLPLLLTSFIEPLALSGDDFSARWQMLVGAGQESQEILKPLRPLVPGEVQAALVTVLRLGRINGIADSSEYVIYGAGSLRTGAVTSTGEKINVGCLAKIEMNVQANAMRVTLRTLHPAATAALLQATKFLLL